MAFAFVFAFAVCVSKIAYYCVLNLIEDEKTIINNGNTIYYGKHSKRTNSRKL